MAFATIIMEKKRTKEIRQVPVGFSWTHLFFGFLVPLFRGDWKYAIIFIGISFFTISLYTFVTAFFYNKLYAQELIGKGYKIKNYNGANKLLINAKLGVY